MDRVTRYPIFSIPHSPGLAGLALNGDTGYTYQLVHVEASDSDWGQDPTVVWGGDQPDVPRAGASCSLRTCLSQPSLRPEDDEDEEMQAYRLDTRDALLRRPPDLERERWAVIQGQAVRKSGTVATLHGAPDNGGPGTPGRPQPMPLEDNVVDREQINFLAARQQFLNLEQANARVPHTPPARAAPEWAPPRVSQAPRALTKPLLANGSAVSVKPQAKAVVLDEQRARGLPTRPGAPARADPGAQSPAASPEGPQETPIEREIRRAQEREAALREQRGLRRAEGPQELVEIPRRPLLTTLSLTAAPRRDRGRPSLYVQRDLAQETQREEDHRREGLQAGGASKPDPKSGGPQRGLRRVLSSDSILDLAPDTCAANPTPELRKVNRIPPDAYQPYLSPGAPQPQVPAFRAPSKPGRLWADEAKAAAAWPEAPGSQRHLSESSRKPWGTKQESWKPSGGPPPANRGVVRWAYFRLRPLRFRVPEVPQKAESPRSWGWEVAGAPALRLQRSQSSELLEREVESVLRREQEVAEERRNALFPKVFSPQPDGSGDGDPDSRSSSRASGEEGPGREGLP